jgi:hypothetical protein
MLSAVIVSGGRLYLQMPSGAHDGRFSCGSRRKTAGCPSGKTLLPGSVPIAPAIPFKAGFLPQLAFLDGVGVIVGALVTVSVFSGIPRKSKSKFFTDVCAQV